MALLSTLGEHVAELEHRVSSNEDNLSDIQKRLKSIEGENSYLRDKLDELENRSRAYNLRFIHVPEKSEGKNIHGFIGGLIQQLLGVENFPVPPALERVHRSPMQQSQNQKNFAPRPILVKLLSLQDKFKILRLAREKHDLKYNGKRVHIFPDFSTSLRQKRREFDVIKKKLRELDIDYSLLYPAALKIISDGKSLLCKTPGEVESFLRDL
uniref:L1 transposable element RRM domain-containing protein n=1 Tax=Cyprinus carpio TaxID=7962 RepID=A0A8C1LNQ7_CYPCA